MYSTMYCGGHEPNQPSLPGCCIKCSSCLFLAPCRVAISRSLPNGTIASRAARRAHTKACIAPAHRAIDPLPVFSSRASQHPPWSSLVLGRLIGITKATTAHPIWTPSTAAFDKRCPWGLNTCRHITMACRHVGISSSMYICTACM